jgi:NAD+ diphosphatase
MALYPDFTRLYPLDTATAGKRLWLPFRGRELLVRATGEAFALLADTAEVQEVLGSLEPIVLGELNGASYLTGEIASEAELPNDWRAIDLWRLHGRIAEQDWGIAGYASHVLHWRRTSGFCPVCGQPAGAMQPEWMRACTGCGHIRYPQISPAVLVLVHDGADRVLLSHQPGWGETYSILAGFVLPGESLEECVRREVEEEVGIQVTDLVYRGSQPWPFPQQLMIGFAARYQSGELRIDTRELDAAAWFDFREMPPLPPPVSLSRQMLDTWSRAQRDVEARRGALSAALSASARREE